MYIYLDFSNSYGALDYCEVQKAILSFALSGALEVSSVSFPCCEHTKREAACSLPLPRQGHAGQDVHWHFTHPRIGAESEST